MTDVIDIEECQGDYEQDLASDILVVESVALNDQPYPRIVRLNE